MINIINNVTLMDFSDVKNHDKVNINNLVSNTANTWQVNRSEQEKKVDTELGKFAENSVISALEYLGIYKYHSYDSFRTDNFKYHAPFDGLLCNNLNSELVDLINTSVKEDGNKLNSTIRGKIRNMNALTVEVKSTRLAKKYKDKACFSTYSNKEELDRLINYLKDLDFLAYPYFTRYGNMNYNQYCWYVETKFLNTGLRGSKLNDYIRKIELENASDIYIRAFVDEEDKKVLIMGWIDRTTLLTPPTTHKLILKEKSEVPLYFVKPIRNGMFLGTL